MGLPGFPVGCSASKVSVKVEVEDGDPLFDTTTRAGTSLTGEVVAFSLGGEFSSGTSLSGESFVFLLEGGPSSIGSNLEARATFLHKVFLFIFTFWPANAVIALSTALRHKTPFMCFFLYD